VVRPEDYQTPIRVFMQHVGKSTQTTVNEGEIHPRDDIQEDGLPILTYSQGRGLEQPNNLQEREGFSVSSILTTDKPVIFPDPFHSLLQPRKEIRKKNGFMGITVPKKKRYRLSHYQHSELEKAFLKFRYPPHTVRDQLVNSTGLDRKRIKFWYQKRRAKERRLAFIVGQNIL